MSTRVLAVSKKFRHFGSYSGYDHLYNYLNFYMPVSIHQNEMKDWQLKLAKKFTLRNVWSSKYGLFHNSANLFTEYQAFKNAKRIKPDCVHVTYLEDTLGFLADKKKELSCMLFATSHQPPEWWKMTHKNTDIIKSLDGLIVLSKEAKTFFENFLPGRVAYIPHGVDTTFFNYQPRTKDIPKKSILFVGNWLRDFETFVKTIESLEERAKGMFCYNIVYPTIPEIPLNPLHRLLKYNNIEWHRNISDNELKHLYHNAALLFLPFINGTGNNALLEAAACGTPILTSRLDSIIDCFGGKENLFTVNGSCVEAYIDCIHQVTNDNNYAMVYAKTLQLRKHTEQYLDWGIIAKKHHIFFESILALR